MTPLETALSPLGQLTAFGIILALGVLGGQLATRSIRLPAITGYLLSGLVIGPHGLNLVSQSMIDASRPFITLAFGLALFELGRRVDFRWLVRERALAATALICMTAGFSALYWLLWQVGVPPLESACIAALALASSPPALLEILRETHAEGQVSERMVAFAGLCNLVAPTAFSLTAGLALYEAGSDVRQFLMHPVLQLVASILTGLLAGLASIRLNRWIGATRREAQEILLFALIAITVGICTRSNLLTSIALLTFGLSTRNLRRGYTVSSPYLMRHSALLLVALFVVIGSQLSLPNLASHLYLAPLFVLLRLAIHILGWWLMAPFNGISRRNGALLGMSLTPMAGGAGILLLGQDTPPFVFQAGSLLIALFCLTELLGPILTRFALNRAGETREE